MNPKSDESVDESQYNDYTEQCYNNDDGYSCGIGVVACRVSSYIRCTNRG